LHFQEPHKTPNSNSNILKIIESHIVPAISEKLRLQEYAVGIFKLLPTKSGLKKAIKKQEIFLNGKVAQTSDWIEENYKIDLVQNEEKQLKVFQLKLEVIFEDDHLAVVNKVAGYPTSGNYFKTIEHALPFNLNPSPIDDALAYPIPVHRLDNPTSGLLIIAKTKSAQLQLHQAFEDKTISKIYLALVSGETIIEQNIVTPIDGKQASTSFRRIGFKIQNNLAFSLLEVRPQTGRTHQIRIHLSSLGHSIVGDKLYGDKLTSYFNKGLYLSAIGLEFSHPITGKFLQLKISPPSKFKKSYE